MENKFLKWYIFTHFFEFFCFIEIYVKYLKKKKELSINLIDMCVEKDCGILNNVNNNWNMYCLVIVHLRQRLNCLRTFPPF